MFEKLFKKMHEKVSKTMSEKVSKKMPKKMSKILSKKSSVCGNYDYETRSFRRLSFLLLKLGERSLQKHE
jgi:hypothetical protein